MGTVMKTRFALALGLAAMLAGPLQAEILEQILVKVNGEIFTKTDLEQRQIAYLRAQNQQFRPEDLENDESLRKILADITPALLVDAVDEMLLVQRGRELGYRLGDEQFRSVIENIKKENKIETEEQFQAALTQEGMTMADLRRSLEKQMVLGQVQRVEVFGKISITEAEERVYYDQHTSEFASPATVTLREVLIEVPAASGGDPGSINVGQEEEARQKAEQARARIARGEDFAKVASEVSNAPSKANGGLIGPVNRSELSKPLQDLLAKLSVGEVSEVIRSQRGYQVIKLESASAATVRPFEQVKGEIADKVFNEKRRTEFQKYLTRMRAQAIIEWKNEELKKAYEQRVATAAAPAPGA
jgi:peptidyl-prolyl cis-trans isomerase SurA